MNSAWVLWTPVRGQSSRLRLWGTFAAGATTGGAATGACLAVLAGLLSPVPETARWALLALGIAVLVALDLTQPRLRLPQRRVLIPQDVFDAGLARGILRFGVEYGTGVRTLIPSASSYLVAAFLVAANLPWGLTVLAGAVFGVSRTLAILQFVIVGRDGWQAFLAAHTRALERVGTVTAALALGVAALDLSGLVT